MILSLNYTFLSNVFSNLFYNTEKGQMRAHASALLRWLLGYFVFSCALPIIGAVGAVDALRAQCMFARSVCFAATISNGSVFADKTLALEIICHLYSPFLFLNWYLPYNIYYIILYIIFPAIHINCMIFFIFWVP
jgi:hypothetical protein